MSVLTVNRCNQCLTERETYVFKLFEGFDVLARRCGTSSHKGRFDLMLKIIFRAKEDHFGIAIKRSWT